MTFAKMINRIRRWLAASIAAKPQLPTRHTHTAYPEIMVEETGQWTVRFYSYAPVLPPLVEAISGKSKDRQSASKDAYRAMRSRIDNYRRN